LPRWGRLLAFVDNNEWRERLGRGLNRFAHECRPLKMQLVPEPVLVAAQLDRLFTRPGGSALLVGQAGAGRRSGALLVASMLQMRLCSPRLGVGYGLKQFRNELKTVRGIGTLFSEINLFEGYIFDY